MDKHICLGGKTEHDPLQKKWTTTSLRTICHSLHYIDWSLQHLTDQQLHNSTNKSKPN